MYNDNSQFYQAHHATQKVYTTTAPSSNLRDYELQRQTTYDFTDEIHFRNSN